MKTALHHPDLIRRLIVVDVAPTPVAKSSLNMDGKEESESFQKYIELMKSLDLNSISSRSDAEVILAPHIKVHPIILCLYLWREDNIVPQYSMTLSPYM